MATPEPTTPADQFAKAIQAHHAGQYSKAEQLCRHLLSVDPDNPNVLHLLGLVAFKAGYAQKAIDLVSRAIEVNDQNPDYHGNLGIIYQDLGRFEDAIGAFRQAVHQNPDHFGGRLGLGNAAMTLERPGEAVDEYSRAVAVRPDHAEAQSNLGAALRAVGRKHEAIEAFRRAVAIEPARADLQSNLGDALSEIGETGAAIDAFQRGIELDPDHPFAYTNLASLHITQKNCSEAVAVCDTCLKLDPGNRSALALKAFALNEIGEVKDAARLLDFNKYIHVEEISAPAGFNSLDEFNRQLSEYASTHPTLRFEPGSKSTRGGQQSRELFDQKTGAIAEFEKIITRAVTEYIERHRDDKDHPFPASAPAHWRVTAWSTVLEAEGHQLPHIHPAGWLSGVYYTQIPPEISVEDASQAGWIEFGRPPESLGCSAEPITKTFAPRAGHLILLPSYFHHRTLPFQFDSSRISIAFDVVPVDELYKVGDKDAVERPPATQELMQQAWEAQEASRFEEAHRLCRLIHETLPEDHEAWYVRAMAAWKSGDLESAEEFMLRALEIAPDNARYWDDYGWCLRMMLRPEESAAAYRKALTLNPDNVGSYINIAALLADMNLPDEAQQAYKDAIERQPDCGTAYFGLALMKRFKEGDPEIAAMEKLIDETGMSDRDRSNLFFALGSAYDNMENYDKAFEYFVEGNRVKRSTVQFDSQDEIKNAQRIIRTFTPEFANRSPNSAPSSELPVFILGMPRSGTTLVEQILDSHPKVVGAGEINDLWRCINTVSAHLPPGAQIPEAIRDVPGNVWRDIGRSYVEIIRRYGLEANRIVDKLPFNYTLVGLIRLMLPQAHIIHCVRNPLDTCLSCYVNSFSDDRGFTYDLEDLGHTFVSYQSLMNHWKNLYPSDFLIDIEYEALVSNPETETRRIIDFIGLEWSDDCLQFHKNKRIVNTASFVQVRKPMYKSSIGRWKLYAKHLEPLRRILDHAGISY